MPAYRLKHYNGTANSVPAKRSMVRAGHAISIHNSDAANDLGVSFDSGETFFTIGHGETLHRYDIIFHYFFVVSAAGAAYSALVSEG